MIWKYYIRRTDATKPVFGSCNLILRFGPGYKGINIAADSFEGNIQQQITAGPHLRDFHLLVHCPADWGWQWAAHSNRHETHDLHLSLKNTMCLSVLNKGVCTCNQFNNLKESKNRTDSVAVLTKGQLNRGLFISFTDFCSKLVLWFASASSSRNSRSCDHSNFNFRIKQLQFFLIFFIYYIFTKR